ncbi:iron-containing alcohol dehydrogenase family protein [uncultured Megasphaera sp.]|uniref:iron-containing alcohol dehydrogenase family protein n=1 Tax=uncultured Megasphaera sp. TaxID=165188 RepID=UPI00265AAC1E|nr:iron-containing alcohol dehydrogenase family protein [uncultured Megasphaera sp.]
MFTDYTLVLPAFTIGPDAYEAIGRITKPFGKKVVVIGGKTALSKAEKPLLDAVAKTDLNVLGVLWYGDDATYERVDALLAEEAVQNADIIFGVGGGRAIDTCKVVADKAGKPLFAFPTVASNCAPSTTIAVMYNADKSFAGYYYLPQPPVHTFINMNIVADSPFELFWAGIGDAMSKECESELASRNAEIFHTVLLGRALGKVCTAPLLEYGEQALADFKAGKLSYELQQVVLDIIISTGLVSNCTTGDQAVYYYNSSVAHLFYNSSTVLPQVVEHHLHGEIVSFGVLVLLTYDKQFELRNRIVAFYKKAGYPVQLADLDIKADELDAVVDKAPSITEWKCVPTPLTKEAFKQAILDADAFGRSL